jgi:myo-inositol-1(or 4)-monophosphatase
MSIPSVISKPAAEIEQVIAVAQQAGQLILQMAARGLQNTRSKASEIDLVTEADVAAEQLIRSALHEHYPQVGFWGEESNQPPVEETFWLVDPIDGTTNFANGLEQFAVNIAFCRQEGPLLGVTLELPAQRTYWAAQGNGAYVRTVDGAERRLRVSATERLGAGLLTTGFPYHRGEHEDNNSAEFLYFLARAQGVRCWGSAAMDLAHVASGALAGYWEGWLSPWDAAAGILLVREAGGVVTDYAGAPWTLTAKTLVASNGQETLHQALLEGIHTARASLRHTLL